MIHDTNYHVYQLYMSNYTQKNIKKNNMEPENGPLEQEIPFQNKNTRISGSISQKFWASVTWHPEFHVNPAPNNFGTNKNRGTSMSCSKCIAVKLDTPMAWTTPRLESESGETWTKKNLNVWCIYLHEKTLLNYPVLQVFLDHTFGASGFVWFCMLCAKVQEQIRYNTFMTSKMRWDGSIATTRSWVLNMGEATF